MKHGTILDLKQGESAKILSMAINPLAHARYAAMGLKIGATVSFIRRAAFGGPIHIRIGLTDLAVSRKVAQHIKIDKI